MEWLNFIELHNLIEELGKKERLDNFDYLHNNEEKRDFR